jgi:rod shape-determining protein MreD
MKSKGSAFFRFSYAVIPTVVTIFLIILGGSNFQIDGIGSVIPFFAATALYYWRLYNPQRMRKMIVFCVGLVQDALYGTMFGSTSLILLLFLAIVKAQRDSIDGQPFWACWLIFVPNVAVYAALTWGINSVLNMHFAWSNLLLVQAGVTVLCYPLLHQLFSVIDKQGNV